MSSNTRVTRSKGKSDGLSLPARSRPRRKPTNMENDNGDTILNTTFDADAGSSAQQNSHQKHEEEMEHRISCSSDKCQVPRKSQISSLLC